MHAFQNGQIDKTYYVLMPYDTFLCLLHIISYNVIHYIAEDNDFLLVPDLSRQDLYGISNRPVVYSEVACTGSEASITECSKQEHLQFQDCYNPLTAGVLCTDGGV